MIMNRQITKVIPWFHRSLKHAKEGGLGTSLTTVAEH